MEDIKDALNCEEEFEEEPVAEEKEVSSEEDLTESEKAVLELKESLSEAEKDRDRFKELAGRAQADLINYRNRTEREVRRMRELAGEKSVLELLPVLDNLGRVLEVPEGADLKTVIEGIEMVERQFTVALENLGVNAILSLNEPFSPKFHEAVGSVEVEDKSLDGAVVEEFQKGYVMGEKVIRPAKVRIGCCK